MTYHDHRKPDSRDRPRNRMGGNTRSTSAAWIAGGLSGIVVILVAVYIMSDRDGTVATRGPAATTANAPVLNPSAVGETTGSGISATPNNPPPTNR